MKSIPKTPNEIPALLARLCKHPECPDWLKEGIWDTVCDAANRGRRPIRFDEDHWKYEFESIISEVTA